MPVLGDHHWQVFAQFVMVISLGRAIQPNRLFSLGSTLIALGWINPYMTRFVYHFDSHFGPGFGWYFPLETLG